MLAPACRTLGIVGVPDEALLNPAVRAAVQAAVRAQLAGRPVRRAAPRAVVIQTAFGFDHNSVDIKRRAANDRDED